eukprot:gene21806-22780_t
MSLLGVDYERQTVGILPGNGNDAPSYRALNPAGTVPTLVDGDIVLTRPEAMLVHLAERHDDSRGWLPADAATRASVFDWLAFAAGDLRAAEDARLKSIFGLEPAWADARLQARAALRVMEGHLVGRSFDALRFFAGEGPTIADIALFPAVALAADFGIGLEEFPRLLIWSRQIHSLKGFVTMPGVREIV